MSRLHVSGGCTQCFFSMQLVQLYRFSESMRVVDGSEVVRKWVTAPEAGVEQVV